MAQSLVKNYLHIIFSTKHRQPFIDEPIADELYSYIGGVCRDLGSPPIKVGGHKDHVHILCLLSKNISLVELLGKIKSSSSGWAKTFGDSYQNFYWQSGYGAFSVSPSQVEKVLNYIKNQDAHHAKTTFKDEYRSFLNKYDVDYDERYVWD